jgi:hypothetical protein
VLGIADIAALHKYMKRGRTRRPCSGHPTYWSMISYIFVSSCSPATHTVCASVS